MTDDRDETPIRVGIAGLGRSGWSIHAIGLTNLEEKYRIVAVSDPRSERREEAAARFGCRTHADTDALFADEEIELAVVATPTPFHTPNAIAALRAGKHVVCEKPVAVSTADADQMIAAALETGKTLVPFHNRRYTPDFLKVREVIASGKLGRIVLIRIVGHGFGRRWDWQTLKEFGGGSLNNNGSHYLDMALQFLGDAEPEVFCHLERTLTSGDADDHCKIILRAAGAPMVDVEITSACAYPQDAWFIMGTRGGLTGSGSSLTWKYVDFDKLPPRPVDRNPTPDRSYNSEEYSWTEETWEPPGQDIPGAGGIAVLHFYEDLYETLRNGAPLVITAQSVRRLIALLEKCHELCPV